MAIGQCAGVILLTMKCCKLSSIGHVCQHTLPKLILQGIREGGRRRERSHKSWNSSIKEWTDQLPSLLLRTQCRWWQKLMHSHPSQRRRRLLEHPKRCVEFSCKMNVCWTPEERNVAFSYLIKSVINYFGRFARHHHYEPNNFENYYHPTHHHLTEASL